MRFSPGQVAVITGAASGIGRALTKALADRGLIVIATDVEEQALQSLAAESPSGRVTTETLDVRSPEQFQEFADRVHQQHGKVDIVFNNAGVIAPRAYVWEQDQADWRWQAEVNYFGVLNGLRAFVPDMVRRNEGHVVNTSSVTGLGIVGIGMAAYGASKHAVVGLTEWLRADLDSIAPGVRTTVFCPGAVDTRIRESERNRPAEFVAQSRGVTPVDRNYGTPLPSISASLAVDRLLAGIETGVHYLPVGPGVTELARERVARVLADLERLERLEA